VITGPSGSGKTTIGREVAARRDWRFVDADDHHTAANVERMRSGLPLTEALRAPWLAGLAELILRWIEEEEEEEEEGVGARGLRGHRRAVLVLACSALTRAYRRTLAAGSPAVRFAFLEVDPARLKERLAARTGHFMPAELLDSQLETLERPAPDEPVWVIPANGSIAETVPIVLERVDSWIPRPAESLPNGPRGPENAGRPPGA